MVLLFNTWLRKSFLISLWSRAILVSLHIYLLLCCHIICWVWCKSVDVLHEDICKVTSIQSLIYLFNSNLLRVATITSCLEVDLGHCHAVACGTFNWLMPFSNCKRMRVQFILYFIRGVIKDNVFLWFWGFWLFLGVLFHQTFSFLWGSCFDTMAPHCVLSFYGWSSW